MCVHVPRSHEWLLVVPAGDLDIFREVACSAGLCIPSLEFIGCLSSKYSPGLKFCLDSKVWWGPTCLGYTGQDRDFSVKAALWLASSGKAFQSLLGYTVSKPC